MLSPLDGSSPIQHNIPLNAYVHEFGCVSSEKNLHSQLLEKNKEYKMSTNITNFSPLFTFERRIVGILRLSKLNTI